MKGNLIFNMGGVGYGQDYFRIISGFRGNTTKTAVIKDIRGDRNVSISYAVSKGYKNNPGTKLVIILENDLNTLIAPVNKIIKNIILILIISLVFVLIISIAIFKYVGKKIQVLVSATQKISKGDLSARAIVSGDNEFSQLATNFNKMAQTLEENNISRQEFTSIAVHQLKTPLAAIRWNLELIKEGNLGKISNNINNKIGEIHNSVIGLISTVSDLLKVFKIEANGGKDSHESLLVNSEIQQILGPMIILAKSKKINIEYIKSIHKPVVAINKQMFKEIIDNLLSNAIKYSNIGGKVELRIKAQKKNIVISVTDNGVGIPESEQDQVFNKFFRATNALKQRVEGSGLGLFIAKSNAKMWGGDITFTSKEGIGSRFELRLPRIKQAEPTRYI